MEDKMEREDAAERVRLLRRAPEVNDAPDLRRVPGGERQMKSLRALWRDRMWPYWREQEAKTEKMRHRRCGENTRRGGIQFSAR